MRVIFDRDTILATRVKASGAGTLLRKGGLSVGVPKGHKKTTHYREQKYSHDEPFYESAPLNGDERGCPSSMGITGLGRQNYR